MLPHIRCTVVLEIEKFRQELKAGPMDLLMRGIHYKKTDCQHDIKGWPNLKAAPDKKRLKTD